MSTIRIPTNFNIDLDFEIPEFYRRLLALLTDMLILFFYLKIEMAILENVQSSRNIFNSDAQSDLQWLSLILFMPVILYHPVCEITMNGQSIGKKILGLRVVNINGGKPSISQFLIRWLIRTSDIMIVVIILSNLAIFLRFNLTVIISMLLFVTDIVLVITTRKAQRLGDILANTILIRVNTKSSINETVFMDVADNYVPSFPQIMQLSDRDINAIKSILDTARKKGDYRMADAAADKIKSHLKISSALSPFDFLDTLLRDYNYLSVK
jgi:uncharacterized RDD family membrane protein YckC